MAVTFVKMKHSKTNGTTVFPIASVPHWQAKGWALVDESVAAAPADEPDAPDDTPAGDKADQVSAPSADATASGDADSKVVEKPARGGRRPN